MKSSKAAISPVLDNAMDAMDDPTRITHHHTTYLQNPRHPTGAAHPRLRLLLVAAAPAAPGPRQLMEPTALLLRRPPWLLRQRPSERDERGGRRRRRQPPPGDDAAAAAGGPRAGGGGGQEEHDGGEEPEAWNRGMWVFEKAARLCRCGMIWQSQSEEGRGGGEC